MGADESGTALLSATTTTINDVTVYGRTHEEVESMARKIATKFMAHPRDWPFGTILQFRSRMAPLTGAKGMVVGPSPDPLRIEVLVLDGDRENTIQDVLRSTWFPVE